MNPSQAAGQNGAGLPAHVAAKIVSREELLARTSLARAHGHKLVQCHGCFDIVHPGHIRHLRQAKSLGTMLLVSITGDSSIAKGVGRPLIPEELRAENLASLDFVDLVYIESDPTAVDLLDAVRPDVYVKGKEYENNTDPRFLAERKAVERHGGRIVFSSGDVVFSSTALIAAMESSVDPYHQRLLALTRHPALQGPELYQSIARFRGKRVVVVGESIIDSYVLCDRPEVASESPVMTLRPIEARRYDGGAAVVARHIAALGGKPVLVTALPDSSEAEELRHRLECEGITVRAFTCGQTIPEKQRFLVGTQKLMKPDLFERYVIDAGQQDRFVGLARETCASETTDATIITDFGLGLFSSRMLVKLCAELRPVTRILSGDVSGRRSSLRGLTQMDLLCPSETEARDAMGLQSEGLPLVTWKLLEETGSRSAIITLGADGLIAFDRLPNQTPDTVEWRSRLVSEHIPALCPIALDPLGCGDSLLAAATLAMSTGATPLVAGFIGAAAASVQAQRLGNTAISASDLRREIARTHTAHLTYTGADPAARFAPLPTAQTA
ncbi:MAG: PfkB family carbohydrate kinase [Phycisphaerales bacterium]